MNLIFTALILATHLNAGICQQRTSGECPANSMQVFEKEIATANEPVFDFPISRALGVGLDYRFEPPQLPKRRVFSFLIAESFGSGVVGR